LALAPRFRHIHGILVVELSLDGGGREGVNPSCWTRLPQPPPLKRAAPRGPLVLVLHTIPRTLISPGRVLKWL
jgi:hypothetical protein